MSPSAEVPEDTTTAPDTSVTAEAPKPLPDTTAILPDTSVTSVANELLPVTDTALTADTSRAAAPSPPPAKSEDAGESERRQRIVRETTVNTIDELKGRYRSPKKALFMSLVVPGLGQAYVGHYYRAAAYVLADVAMIAGWRHYVVVKHDRQVRRYRQFADENWSQSKYEDSVSQVLSIRDKEARILLTPHREFYCNYVVNRTPGQGERLFEACRDLPSTNDYSLYREVYGDANRDAEARGEFRSNFPDVHQFYESIGKHQEFISGWADANDVIFGDSSIIGTSDHRSRYIGMRAQATEYSRMQVYFMGGIVLNHIISALDAALAARFHNRALYQTEVSWYDRIRLESVLGRDSQGLPVPTVLAHIPF